MFAGASRPLDLVRRLLAGGLGGLVLILSLLAVSPEAHHALHASDEGHAEEACPIFWLAAGVDLPPLAPVVAPPIDLSALPFAVRETGLLLVEPRHLRRLERGPPARA